MQDLECISICTVEAVAFSLWLQAKESQSKRWADMLEGTGWIQDPDFSWQNANSSGL